MGDTFDIHNILQTGYFTTSRARNTTQLALSYPTTCNFFVTAYSSRRYSPPSTPSSALPSLPKVHYGVPHLPLRSVATPSAREYPPAPSVEDEVESLSREHGVSAACTPSDEEAQSRGEIDQNPLIMEVHEFNPERRFVIVTGSTETTNGSTKEGAMKSKSPRDEGSQDKRPLEAKAARRDGSQASERSEYRDAKPSIHRRKSRQTLPRLETDIEFEAASTQSARNTAVPESYRPSAASSSQSRTPRDEFLSPNVTKHGSAGRDKAYYGYSQGVSDGSRSPSQRSQSTMTNNRKYEEDFGSRRPSPPKTKRSSSTIEPEKLRRRLSNERQGDSHPRDSPVTHSGRPDASPLRDGNQSGDEHKQDPWRLAHKRGKSIIIQEGTSARNGGEDGNDQGVIRPQSRASTIPLPSPRSATFADAPAMPPRSSATFPLAEGGIDKRERAKVQLPYPEDDPFLMPSMDEPDISTVPFLRSQIPPAVPPHGVQLSMPEIPDRPPTTVVVQTKPVRPFDPTRNVVQANNAAGSYRRCHESKDQVGRFPECLRVRPVEGLMDWLTLPRSDFNICPECYQATFSHSDFRTQFQPILRPTSEAIACDFGASPWYRLAWLLTLRNGRTDLQLFHQVAKLMAATAKEPCPGSRKSKRVWLTVKDPYTRKSVPGFTVCYQCARMAEGLLPNLTGLFVLANAKSEATRSMCALHFAPDRKRFVLYFDVLETASYKALDTNRPPKIEDIAKGLDLLSVGEGCQEDDPVINGYWHMMQFLPQFTVCAECFEEAVRPRLEEDNALARNFFTKAQRLPDATCQLYSSRMREIFWKACRQNDPVYLENKVKERIRKEQDIHAKLLRLDREHNDHEWTKKQVDGLIREWQRWE
ncbi:hypothetical protein S40288_01473 [Stachybotrys chartarum IBT 40288]|nr:hypothetical protein S40288_01473 [Stachybotrys chartarum IBT 40288]